MSNLYPDFPGHRAAKWAIKDIRDDNWLVKTLYRQPDYSGSSTGRSLTPWLCCKVMKEYAMFNNKRLGGRNTGGLYFYSMFCLSLSHSCQRGRLEEPGGSQCVQQPDRRAAHSDQQPAEAQTPQPWVGHRMSFFYFLSCVCVRLWLFSYATPSSSFQAHKAYVVRQVRERAKLFIWTLVYLRVALFPSGHGCISVLNWSAVVRAGILLFSHLRLWHKSLHPCNLPVTLYPSLHIHIVE